MISGKKILLGLLGISAILSCQNKPVEAPIKNTSTLEKEDNTVKYEANWESLSKHEETPEWFQDAKLGIYLHWGVYSVPAFDSEWYPRHMYMPEKEAFEHHKKKYGDQSKFNYHDFVPMFKAENFNAEEWAS